MFGQVQFGQVESGQEESLCLRFNVLKIKKSNSIHYLYCLKSFPQVNAQLPIWNQQIASVLARVEPIGLGVYKSLDLQQKVASTPAAVAAMVGQHCFRRQSSSAAS